MASNLMGVAVLDGGMGHLLKSEKLSASLDQPFDSQFIASCLANISSPQVVVDAHKKYISCGCQVITTNNFVATPYHLDHLKGAVDCETVTLAAAACARKALEQAEASIRHSRVRIAGCLPPLRESYEACKGQDMGNDMETYKRIASCLAPSVDIFLCETMSNLQGMKAAMAAAENQGAGKLIWVSMTVQDHTPSLLRGGESLESALSYLSRSAPDAVLVNCCAPPAVTAALDLIRTNLQDSPIQRGGYANGFERTTSDWLAGRTAEPDPTGDFKHGIITPTAYASWAKEWAYSGTSIIGGCCGVGPEHMQAVVSTLSG